MQIKSPEFWAAARTFGLVWSCEPFVDTYAVELVAAGLACHFRKLFCDWMYTIIADSTFFNTFKLVFNIFLPHQQRIKNCRILRFHEGPDHKHPFCYLLLAKFDTLVGLDRDRGKRIILRDCEANWDWGIFLNECWNHDSCWFLYVYRKIPSFPLSFLLIDDINLIFKNRLWDKSRDVICGLLLEFLWGVWKPFSKVKRKHWNKLVEDLKV